MLADDEITVRVGREVLHLRPTLRAAFRLERRHGGFDKIVRAVADENVTVIADVIREGADVHSSIPDLLLSVGANSLRIGLAAITGPLLDFVFALAGVDPKASDEKAEAGERITFAEHHTRLYRIGTGWLGWSADDTWAATPAEITEAYAGRLDMLRAMFGGGLTEANSGSVPNADFDEAGWAHLKMLAATGGNRAIH